MQDNIIDKLLERREKQKELAIENIEEFKKAVNSVFSGDAGLFFAKYWLKEMGLFDYDDNKDGVSLVENKGAKRFYLRYVRPNLSNEIRNKLEGQL